MHLIVSLATQPGTQCSCKECRKSESRDLLSLRKDVPVLHKVKYALVIFTPSCRAM